MNIDCRIVNKSFDELAKRITRKVIRSLQSIKSTLSGEDSGLTNTWDEICAQVQGEESFYWNVYEEQVESEIRLRIAELPLKEKCLLWLYTENGEKYYEENSEAEMTYNIEDIVEHIKLYHILSEAADWSNKRIKDYLGF